MTDLWLFFLGVFALLATPGPTNALLLMGGAQNGFLRGTPLVIGELLGYSSAILIIHIVLQPIMIAYPLIGVAFKLAFVLYIAMLSIRLWRNAGKPLTEKKAVNFQMLYLATLLNPKAFGFALILIPFQSPDLPAYLLVLAAVIITCGTGWLFVGSLATRIAGKSGPLIAGRIASLVMAVFAGLVFLSLIRG